VLHPLVGKTQRASKASEMHQIRIKLLEECSVRLNNLNSNKVCSDKVQEVVVLQRAKLQWVPVYLELLNLSVVCLMVDNKVSKIINT
jgi:hypothetical protein